MTSTKVVFLSGTRKDLKDYFVAAAEVINALPGYRATSMETLTAEDIPPDRWSRREATTPDILLGLLGHYYGYVPDGSDRSLTEQEYDTAKTVGIDRLMFLTDDGDAEVVDGQTSAAKEAISRFRQRVEGDVVRQKVHSVEEFKDSVQTAIREWEKRTIRGTTTDVATYYAPLISKQVLHGHHRAFVGQTASLSSLQEFAAGDDRILVLHAPWGRGKSRLLLEWATGAEGGIRFIREEAELSRQSLDITPVDPCVLVLEDIQRREKNSLRALLSFLARCDTSVKLIATTRSGQRDVIGELIREHAFDARKVGFHELPALAEEEQLKLVSSIIGHEGPDPAIIAHRTRGNTLAAVIAAQLYRQGELSLGEIEDAPAFQFHVLDHFRQAALQEAGRNEECFREALRVVALAGPIRPADQAAMDELARLLGWKTHQLHKVIDQLEDSGLLMRRGGLVRIPVDAISESELYAACLNRHGESTGYAEHALAELGPGFRSNVMRNLAIAELDASRQGFKADFLSGVWATLLDEFKKTPRSGRLELIRELEDAAPLQPNHALTFVRGALQADEAPEEEIAALEHLVKEEWVNDALAPLLRAATRYPDLVAEACDLLWELAGEDVEEAMRSPESPERILREAGGFGYRKSVEAAKAFTDWAERQLTQGGPVPADRLAEYLRPMLQKEAGLDWADGKSFHLASAPLKYDVVRPIRQQVLGQLQRIAETADLPGVETAIDVLGAALIGPMGLYGRVVEDDEYENWFSEEVDVLEIIRSIRQERDMRTVDVCIFSKINWVARHSRNAELRERATDLVSNIKKDLRGSLECAITPTHTLTDAISRRAGGYHRRAINATAEQLLTEGIDAQELLTRIAETTQELRTLISQAEPGPLLFEIARNDTAAGRELMKGILAEGDHVLADQVSAVLHGLLEGNREVGILEIQNTLENGGKRALISLANMCFFGDIVEQIGSEVAVSHFRVLLSNQSTTVRKSALLSLGHCKGIPDRARLELLLGFDPGADPALGEQWAQALAGSKLHESANPSDRVVMINRLRQISKIDHWGTTLLQFLNEHEPEATIAMILARIRKGDVARSEFEAVPRLHNTDPFERLPADQREIFLMALGEFLDEGSVRSLWAEEVFTWISQRFPESARNVRRLWITSRSATLIQRVARSFRQSGSPLVIFGEREVIVELLRESERIGAECRKVVERTLTGVARSGMRSGTLGEAFPLDVEIRDNALALAEEFEKGSVEERFFRRLAESTQGVVDAHMEREEERSV
jgi:hypothetical protein